MTSCVWVCETLVVRTIAGAQNMLKKRVNLNVAWNQIAKKKNQKNALVI